MGRVLRDIELMRFNVASPLTGNLYVADMDLLGEEIERLMNSDSIGVVSPTYPGQVDDELSTRPSAGTLERYELVHELTSGAVFLYVDIALSPEAEGMQNLFPDLSGFVICADAFVLAEQNDQTVYDVQKILGFNFTFLKGND